MLPLDSSYIGIAVSIAGNVLISVSLNTQKLAHKRLSEDYDKQKDDTSSTSRTKNPRRGKQSRHQSERTPLLSHARSSTPQSSKKAHDLAVYAVVPAKQDGLGQDDSLARVHDLNGTSQVIREVPHPEEIIRDLAKSSTEVAVQDSITGRIRRKWLEIRGRQRSESYLSNDGEASHAYGIASRGKRRNRRNSKTSAGEAEVSSGSGRNVYASRLWWLGLCLMALGELGNFTSYAFAPASVVAPLGTTALIANCFIAPLMLHERFRKKDIVGIGFSIAGAVTIVLSSKSENKSLTPHQFIRAVSQPAFFIYAFVSLGLIFMLLILSRTRAGDRYLAIDILICALCGGFTVLSVKAFSSFLTQNFLDCFKQWPTYPVLAVLAITAVMQIIFLNKALQRFESRVVVPTQFVSFTISAITGSAILYRDFEDVQLGKVIAFFLGCVLIFVGVVFLTSSKYSHTDEQDSGDMSQSSVTNDGQANDSQISVTSEGRLLDGVALTSHGPATAGHELSRSPGKVGHVLRKYKSIGMLPSRGPGTSSAVATPIRAARPPSLATSKLFSPGYILIAGSGLGHLSSNSSDDGQTVEDENNTDLESGRSRTSSESQNSTETIQRGGQETLMETATTDREATHTGDIMNEPEGDEEYEPMTRSALMRRSGTV